MANISVINGPNLNLLGQREPELYGNQSLADINKKLEKLGKLSNHRLNFIQSNAEHELIEHIQKSPENNIEFILINPASFTHTSIALRDALLAVNIPYIEIHLTNIAAREPFRHVSYFSDKAHGVISGLGPLGYELALQAAHHYLN